VSAVTKRLERLEAATGAPSEWCECPGPLVMRWPEPGETEPPAPAPCPTCGRPVRTVVLRWPDDARDW